MAQLEGLENSAENQLTLPSQTVNRAGKKQQEIHIYIHTPSLCVCVRVQAVDVKKNHSGDSWRHLK